MWPWRLVRLRARRRQRSGSAGMQRARHGGERGDGHVRTRRHTQTDRPDHEPHTGAVCVGQVDAACRNHRCPANTPGHPSAMDSPPHVGPVVAVVAAARDHYHALTLPRAMAAFVFTQARRRPRAGRGRCTRQYPTRARFIAPGFVSHARCGWSPPGCTSRRAAPCCWPCGPAARTPAHPRTAPPSLAPPTTPAARACPSLPMEVQ